MEASILECFARDEKNSKKVDITQFKCMQVYVGIHIIIIVWHLNTLAVAC